MVGQTFLSVFLEKRQTRMSAPPNHPAPGSTIPYDHFMSSLPPPRPTKADLIAAKDKTVPDIIRPDLKVLFVGINPGLYTAAIGHHFGRPGNRFWPAMYAGGFTDRLYLPWEKEELL